MAHEEEFTHGWDETTTVMRPMMEPTYKDVFDIPNGAEVMLIVGQAYNCFNMSEGVRGDMRERLAEAGEEYLNHPEQVMIAELGLWVHADDISDEKRANIAAHLAALEAQRD